MNDRSKSLDSTPMGVSIGAMSKATGIPANTLRTWERRYGFPQPQRTESGQRLYDAALIGHLRLIHRALEAGHRPKQVLNTPLDDLAVLVGTTTPTPAKPDGANALEGWMRAAKTLDGPSLDNWIRGDAAKLGLLRFLTERVGPFLTAMGEAWRQNDLEVYQEHWASERIRRFLNESWEPLSTNNAGRALVASTLPSDRHDLGLQMAAVVAAMCGWKIVFLGRDTPIADIASAVKTSDAAAVLVSISMWTDSEKAWDHVQQLRSMLISDIEVVIGGTGAPAELTGVTTLADLESLYRWAARTG